MKSFFCVVGSRVGILDVFYLHACTQSREKERNAHLEKHKTWENEEVAGVFFAISIYSDYSAARDRQ